MMRARRTERVRQLSQLLISAGGPANVGAWRDSEVSECVPYFRLLGYSRPIRHASGPSKMTRCGLTANERIATCTAAGSCCLVVLCFNIVLDIGRRDVR
jgi:hypothetical protein